MKRLIERETDACFIVLTRDRGLASGPSFAAKALAKTCQQIGEIDIVERELISAEALRPVGRRPHLFSRSMAPQLIERSPLFLVLQRFVGANELLESLFRVGFFRHVRVVLQREFAVGLLDLFRARVPLDTQDRIVVLVFHRLGPPSPTHTLGRLPDARRSSHV